MINSADTKNSFDDHPYLDTDEFCENHLEKAYSKDSLEKKDSEPGAVTKITIIDKGEGKVTRIGKIGRKFTAN